MMVTPREERLAKALLADQARVREAEVVPACFVCGVRRTLRFRRFCSERCRDAYDGGYPGHEQDWLRPAMAPIYRDSAGHRMWSTATGFLIRCAGCQKEFDSKGLKYCSPDCGRRDRERQGNLAVMAEVGVEPKAKRLCQAPGCGATIPQWTKGKRTRSSQRFCSSKCASRVRAAKIDKSTAGD